MLNSYIRFCKCQRFLLTPDEIKEGLPCASCQKEYLKAKGKTHEERFHQMFDVECSNKLREAGY